MVSKLGYSLDGFNRQYIMKDKIKDLIDKSIENIQFASLGREKIGKSGTEPKICGTVVEVK